MSVIMVVVLLRIRLLVSMWGAMTLHERIGRDVQIQLLLDVHEDTSNPLENRPGRAEVQGEIWRSLQRVEDYLARMKGQLGEAQGSEPRRALKHGRGSGEVSIPGLGR